MNSLRLITFDATGTLLKFRKPPVQFYLEVAAKHGVNADQERMKVSFKNTWKELNAAQPHFGLCWKSWWTDFVVGTFKGSGVSNTDDQTLTKISEELTDLFRTSYCWEVKPGAEPLLKRLEAKKPNICVGIISNFDPRLREIINGVGIAKYFDFVILSHERQISKPSKEVFQLAMKTAVPKIKGIDTLNPEQCLHVGDNYDLDFVGAESAGWNGALVIPEEELPSHLPRSLEKPGALFNSLENLDNHLFKT